MDPTRTDPPDVNSIDTHNQTILMPFTHGVLVEKYRVLGQNEPLQHALHSTLFLRKFPTKKYLKK